MPSGPESTNPFVRFKHRVDDQISQTVRSIWSLPSSSSSSSNKAIQDDQGHRSLPDGATPISTNSGRPFVVLGKVPDEDISSEMTKLAKEIDENPGMADEPFSRERDALESAVSRSLRDETIHSWVKYSAYSPWRLQDTLPQPVPKDVPAASFPSINEPGEQSRFTFRDAFEDLLAVSSGQPLKPRAELESRLTTPPRRPGSLFTELSSARSWRDWTANIERRWLWDAYFPPEQFCPTARRIVTIATSDLFRRELTAGQAEGYIHQLVADAAACEEERRWQRAQLFWPGKLTPGAAVSSALGTLLGLHGARGMLHDSDIEDHPLMQSLAAGAREVFKPVDREDARRRLQPDAETDEDLYRTIESDYAQSRRPRRLDMPQPRESDEAGPALVGRSPQEGETSGVSKSGSDNNNEEWIQEFPEPDGGKTVKSVARKTGPWMSHETVTTTRYDADGNVVQRMSQRQHSASKEFRWSSSGSGEDDENAEDEANTKSSSSGKGWFWTK